MAERKQKPQLLSARMKNTFDFLFPFLVVGVMWELLVRTGIVQLHSLPAPSALLAKLWNLAFVNGVLWKHLFSSLYRLFAGYILAVIFGTAIGALLAQKQLLHDLFEPTLNLLMSVPTIAWIPIFLITLGLGDKTVIMAIFTSSFFAITYNTMRGIEMIDKSIVNAAHLMGLRGLAPVFGSAAAGLHAIHHQRLAPGHRLRLARAGRRRTVGRHDRMGPGKNGLPGTLF